MKLGCCEFLRSLMVFYDLQTRVTNMLFGASGAITYYSLTIDTLAPVLTVESTLLSRISGTAEAGSILGIDNLRTGAHGLFEVTVDSTGH